MSFASVFVTTHPIPASNAAPSLKFGDLYLRLLRPDGHGPALFQKLLTAASLYDARFPATAAALVQTLTQILGQPVWFQLSQLHALKRLAEHPLLAELSPWKAPPSSGEQPEMVPASSLHDIYLALLKPDGGMMKRFKAVQAAAAVYEPGTPGSQEALEKELSRLIGYRAQLSEPQLRCFKELLIDEPAFAHIAPWEDLTASW